jgi:XapX domain-containing protein
MSMKLAIGFLVSFLVGAACRYFDIPVGSPPVLPGAMLVVAMTLGYTSVDHVMRGARTATTKHLCGGPTGLPATATHSQSGMNPKV